MPGRDIIVIGCSAGGIEAVVKLIRDLPADIPAAIFVAAHTPPTNTNALPSILTRAGSLPAVYPEDGDAIINGRIYVAPPDHHMLIQHGCINLTHGPKENGHRPAIDPLFRTAAYVYRRRVIGIVLSGMLDDGTAGLLAVKKRGGISIVQDPDDALFADMPRSAIESVSIDHILPVSSMTALLLRLVHKKVPGQGETRMSNNGEQDLAEGETDALRTKELPGSPTAFTCPECGGSLWEVDESGLRHYRCHVGHAYTQEGFVSEHTKAVESALWTALRIMEERAELMRKLARNSRKRDYSLTNQQFELKAQDAEQRADTIRKVLLKEDSESSTAKVKAGLAVNRVDTQGAGR